MEKDKLIKLLPEQQKEILERDKEFIKGKTIARDWNEIKKEMDLIYVK